MCALGYIFQSKGDKLIGDIKGIKRYINDIIVLSKDCFKNHIDQLSISIGRFRASDLKANYPKYSFGLKDIPYLGYVITREGIKPDTKKVQGIIDIGRPTTTTEAQALIGMVQYYREIWPRYSHVVAPLIEANINPKVGKYCGMTH